MKEHYHLHLLYRKETGALSDQEAQELDTWLQASPENQALAEQVSYALKHSKSYSDLPEADLDEAYAQVRSRMEMGKSNRKNRGVRRLVILAAAALVLWLMGATVVWQIWNAPSTGSQVFLAESTSEKLELPDGTMVHLKQGSHLTYPKKFSETDRTVLLEGEAFFSVTHQPAAPFSVKISKGVVTVLGTEFNVRSSKANIPAEVMVTQGKVRFSSSMNEGELLLTPGEIGVLDPVSGGLTEKVSSNQNEVAWSRGQLRFRDTPLREVMKDIERTFDIEIEPGADVPQDCTLTGRYTLKAGPETIFKNLETFLGIKWEQQDTETYLIQGGACPE